MSITRKTARRHHAGEGPRSRLGIRKTRRARVFTGSLATGMVAAMLATIPGTAMAVVGEDDMPNPNSGVTDDGHELIVEITSPADGATVPVGALTVTGNASIGGATDNLYYMVDVSGSTANRTFGGVNHDCDGNGVSDEGDDINGDGVNGDVLDCELAAVLAINDSLGSAPINVGYGIFGTSSVPADVTPDAADTPFTSPADADLDGDGDGTPDIEQVVRSTDSVVGGDGSVSLFQHKTVGYRTNFEAALTTINNAFDTRPAEEQNTAFFFSDGVDSFSFDHTTSSALAAAVNDGTVIHTYGVGNGTTGCAEGTHLKEIADATRGTCTLVTDPSALSSAVLDRGGIDRVEVSLNGGDTRRRHSTSWATGRRTSPTSSLGTT
jgi:hypothetical protein